MMENGGNRAESKGFALACQVNDDTFGLSHNLEIFRKYTQITAICNLLNKFILRDDTKKIGTNPTPLPYPTIDFAHLNQPRPKMRLM